MHPDSHSLPTEINSIREGQFQERQTIEGLRAELATLRAKLAEAEGFQAEQWEWVKATFPGEDSAGVIKHLKEEIDELSKSPSDPGELADCFLLVQCLASHFGVNLMAAARTKFDICKARKWKKTEAGWRTDKSAAIDAASDPTSK